jgi:hypothetical protein
MEINKLFNSWNDDNLPDNADIQEKFCQILEYLYDTCPDAVREDISTYILEFSELTEQAAYEAGFRQAFLLWTEILTSK